MVRLREQTIPVNWTDLYNRIFGPTYTPDKLGTHHPLLTQVARTRYGERRPETDDPSAEQLAVRAAFDATQQALQAMPYREKHCYYRLSLGTGMRYGDYFTHLWLSAIYHGLNPASIARPLASCYDHAIPAGWARWTIDLLAQQAAQLTVELTADPGTPSTPPPGLPPATYLLFAFRWWDADPWPPAEYQLLWSATPTQRTSYTITAQVDGAPWVYDSIILDRRTADIPGETVVWTITLSPSSGRCTASNVAPAEIW